MYKALFMAFDGDSVTEGQFKTIEEAWSYIENIGSRWFFYPFCFVVKNKAIVSSFDGAEFLTRKHISTVKKMFDKATSLADSDCDVYEYVEVLKNI
jgi:hypothetical protein